MTALLVVVWFSLKNRQSRLYKQDSSNELMFQCIAKGPQLRSEDWPLCTIVKLKCINILQNFSQKQLWLYCKLFWPLYTKQNIIWNIIHVIYCYFVTNKSNTLTKLLLSLNSRMHNLYKTMYQVFLYALAWLFYFV